MALKHIYRFLLVLAIFFASATIFARNMKEVKFSYNQTVEMGETTFPTMTIQSKGYTMNLLHGYSNNLDASVIRESMTPIGYDQTFTGVIEENKMVVKKVKYELRKVGTEELVDYGEISALTDTKNGKSVKVKIKGAMEQGKEYALKITLLTSEGKKIHYFTRLKYYGNECYLKEKLEFIDEFHKKTFDKTKAQELSQYLEYSSGRQDNFAQVDIHSSTDMVTWGKLKPEVISDIVPTIKEFNIETTSVVLNYYIKATTGSGEEIYRVKEFYRLRYAGGRMYLLKFNRTMDCCYNVEKTSVKKSQLKLGIIKDRDVELTTSSDNSRIAYVREGELWYYHLTENQVVRVFSFKGDAKDSVDGTYNQHDIRILNMDEEGNMNFIVYGYMNRGDYEGGVGILLYKFYAGEKRIEEQVYVPFDTTYQVLKENIGSFSYVSKGNIFYFSMNNVIYSYNIVSKKLNILAKDITSQDFSLVEQDHYIAWQDTSQMGKAKKITILDLETEKKQEIRAKNGENICFIGTIDNNIVYGQVKSNAITESSGGNIVVPMYCVKIVNSQGELLKKYQEKNIYITNAMVKDNVVKLERAKKTTSDGKTDYKKIKSDSILNKEEKEEEAIHLTKRVTESALTEMYISLPAGFVMPKVPSLSTTKNTMITENKILRLEDTTSKMTKYYLYAEGEITGSYTSAAKAIAAADEQMGVVINHRNQIVWERGGKYTNNSIDNIRTVYAETGVTSIGACLKMVLQYNRVEKTGKELSNSKDSMYQILKKSLDHTTLNLTGCTLDEVLYFTSGNRLVIAMKDSENAVIIKGYDEYKVTMIDPGARKTVVMSLSKAEEMFKKAGRVFLSYMPK